MNKLERSILEQVAKDYPELDLSRIIPELQVSEREITSVGFFTSFLPLKADDVLVRAMKNERGLIGPFIEFEDEHGERGKASSDVYIKEGVIDCVTAMSIDGISNVNDAVAFKLIDEEYNIIHDTDGKN